MSQDRILERLQEIIRTESSIKLQKERFCYLRDAKNVSHPMWARRNAQLLADIIRVELLDRIQKGEF